MPLTAGASVVGGTRGARPRARAAMAVMWAGVVPQQPPTMFTQPSSRKRLSLKARLGGVSPYWPRSSGRPALGYTLTNAVASAASERR